jgi:hypothetical protein
VRKEVEAAQTAFVMPQNKQEITSSLYRSRGSAVGTCAPAGLDDNSFSEGQVAMSRRASFAGHIPNLSVYIALRTVLYWRSDS